MKTNTILLIMCALMAFSGSRAQEWSSTLQTGQIHPFLGLGQMLGGLSTQQNASTILNQSTLVPEGSFLQTSFDNNSQDGYDNWITISEPSGAVVYSRTVRPAALCGEQLNIIAVTEVGEDVVAFTGSYEACSQVGKQLVVGTINLQTGNVLTQSKLANHFDSRGTCLMQSPDDEDKVFVAGQWGPANGIRHYWVGTFDWAANTFSDFRYFQETILPYDMTYDLDSPEDHVVIIGERSGSQMDPDDLNCDGTGFLPSYSIALLRYQEGSGVVNVQEVYSQRLYGIDLLTGNYTSRIPGVTDYSIATDEANQQYVFATMVTDESITDEEYMYQPAIGVVDRELEMVDFQKLESGVVQGYRKSRIDLIEPGTSDFRLSFWTAENNAPRSFSNSEYAVTTLEFQNDPSTYGSPVTAKRLGEIESTASGILGYNGFTIATDGDAFYSSAGVNGSHVPYDHSWVHIFKQERGMGISTDCEVEDEFHWSEVCYFDRVGQENPGTPSVVINNISAEVEEIEGWQISCAWGNVWFETGKAGSEEHIDEATYSVYPNPASNVVKLQGLESAATVSLVDMNGRLVIQQSVHPGEELNISTVAPGIYMLQVLDAQGQISMEKLAVE